MTKKTLFLSIILSIALTGCGANPEPVAHKEPGSSCTMDAECQTPIEYLVQSNCPFGSACINNKCQVVCSVINPNIPDGDTCSTDSDCDCSKRPNNSDCVCHDGNCLSVE